MPNEYKLPKILIGADPELFVRNKQSGKLISAHDILPGTKEKPFKVPSGAVQVDGVAAEFNIDPAVDASHFTYFCTEVQNILRGMIGADNELVMEPVAVFDPIYWDKLPKKTKELGCNPDFNGWTGSVNPAPDTSANPTMRTASGHIHIGWSDGKKFDVNDPGFFQDCCIVARQLDYGLGIHSLLWDPDPRRRSMYGKAGCFRPKPYGMEYRTMSNRWLMDQPTMNHVFAQAYFSIQELFKGNTFESKWGYAARNIIDNNITDWNVKTEYQSIRQAFVPPPNVRAAQMKSGLSYKMK